MAIHISRNSFREQGLFVLTGLGEYKFIQKQWESIAAGSHGDWRNELRAHILVHNHKEKEPQGKEREKSHKSFEPSKPVPTNTLPLSRPHLLILLKQEPKVQTSGWGGRGILILTFMNLNCNLL